MAISTSGIGNIDMSMSKNVSKSKDSQKSTDTFACLMDMSAKQTDNESTDSLADRQQTNTVQPAYNNSDVQQYDKRPVAAKNNMKYDKGTVKADDDTIACDDDIIKAAISQLKEFLMQLLGMNENELDLKISENGFNFMDLFNSDKLKDFILKAMDSTELDALTNEKLMDAISGANMKLEEIIGETPDLLKALSDYEGNIDTILADDYAQTDYVKASPDNENTIIGVYNTGEANSSVAADDLHYEVDKADKQTGITDNVDEAAAFDGLSADVKTNGSELDYKNDSHNQGAFSNQSSNILSNLNDAIEQAVEVDGTTSTYMDSAMQADIIRQVIDNIKVNISKDATSMILQLNPENLGRVQINVTSRNGIMQAQITAETEAAKNAIEAGLETLREAFDNQELKVDAVEVNIASYEFFEQESNEKYEEQKQNKASKNRSLNLDDDADETALDENEQLELDIMKSRGNRVSYSI